MLFLCVGSVECKRVLQDKIVARVNGKNILLSDLKFRIEKGGASITVDEAIDQELLFQKAVERKLLATEIEVEKNIVAWKEANGLSSLSEAEFEKRLREEGLTVKKYRYQLSKLLAVKNLRNLELSERVVVTNSEIEKYHKDNPEYSEEKYLLQTKITPDDKLDKHDSIKWIDLDWISEHELVDQMKFVSGMEVGDISKPVRVDQGYQFVKLVKKEESHKRDIKERWVEIEKKIQLKKSEEFEKKYVIELRKKALERNEKAIVRL